MVALVVIALLWGISQPVDARAEGHEFMGYITAIALNVRSGPGTQSEVVGILLKYDPVTVTGTRQVGSTTWYSIEASGGYTTGWVSAGYVKRGDPPAMTAEEPVDYGAKETPTLMRGPFQYVGVKVCQECHADAVGEYPRGASGVWESHFHSAAFQTLKRDYTKEIASRTRGIEDPTTDWRCVKCHVTALGSGPSQLGPDYNEAEGVGCEVCHGPGGSYAKEDHGSEVPNREAMGFRVLRNLDDRREVCTSCHNKASPTYKPFDLRQFSRVIAHWVDDDDAAYRAEAGRESKRRASAIKKAAAATAGTTAATTAAARASSSASSAGSAAADASKSAAAEAAAAKKAEAAKAASAAKAARKAAEAEAAKKAADADTARKAAEAETARKAAEAEATRKAAASKAKAAVPPPPAADNPLAHFLRDIDDVIIMNTEGVKYASLEFPHRKHAGNDYLPGGDCRTCHHTHEGSDSPVSCNECHDIGGDAEETKAKKRYAHAKKKGYPMGPDQEEVSCSGCHKSMNNMLEVGQRQGERAPTKCTVCHARK